MSEQANDDAWLARQATAGLLQHLQRIGISQLPQVDVDQACALVAEQFPQLLVSDTQATPPAVAPPPGSTQPTAQPTAAKPAAVPPRPAASSQQPAAAVGSRLAPVAPVIEGPSHYSLPQLGLEQRQAELASCQSTVAACTRCPQLAFARKHTVFGEGSWQARVCFFGEGPRAEEDRQGRPFVGPAGQLLTKMIEACKLQREEVYLLNTVKCRPPANRNPELVEVENCRGYFEQQLEIIQPEYIVCLGLIAARALLRSAISIGRLRGVFHQYRSSKVLVTYHPDYLLRTPQAKRAAWEDLQLMMKDMGIKP
ncbi:uracil-DNA glycosylase [Planctomycetaceae bacterium SH139]